VLIKIEAPEIVEAIKSLSEAISNSIASECFKKNTSEKFQLNEAIPENEFRIEDIRGKLAALVQSGRQNEVKVLLEQFGVGKLSDLPSEKYADLLSAIGKFEESQGDDMK
jgi:hypothetical protein